MKKTTSGFTIVELLIVIVVIAILATISIVAYSGIQNQAYVSRLKSDMNQITKAVQLHKADQDAIPHCVGGAGTTCDLSTIVFQGTSALPLPQRGSYTYIGYDPASNWAVRANTNRSGSDLCKFGDYSSYPTWFSSAPAC